MRIFLTFLLGAAAAIAQPVSFGVRGGVPFTDAFNTVTTTSVDNYVQNYSRSKEYEIGPMVEVHLPFGLAVEADALYRPLNLVTEVYIAPGNAQSGLYQSSTNISSWEFPIVGKYHILPLPLVKPYIEGGPTFRALGSAASDLASSGITLGGGVEIKISKLRIEPEIRYTHWGSDSASAILAGRTPSNVNQAAVLLGIAF